MADNYYPQGSGPQYQQQYQQYQQQYQQYQQPVQNPRFEEISTGQWVLNLFLVGLPIVGIILLFVWAFGSSTPASKQNWARANLIWILIIIAISIIITVAATVMGIPMGTSGRYR